MQIKCKQNSVHFGDSVFSNCKVAAESDKNDLFMSFFNLNNINSDQLQSHYLQQNGQGLPCVVHMCFFGSQVFLFSRFKHFQ